MQKEKWVCPKCNQHLEGRSPSFFSIKRECPACHREVWFITYKKWKKKTDFWLGVKKHLRTLYDGLSYLPNPFDFQENNSQLEEMVEYKNKTIQPKVCNVTCPFCGSTDITKLSGISMSGIACGLIFGLIMIFIAPFFLAFLGILGSMLSFLLWLAFVIFLCPKYLKFQCDMCKSEFGGHN